MFNDTYSGTPHINIPPELLKELIRLAQIDNKTALRLINTVNSCKSMVELDSLIHTLELKRTEWGFNKPTCSYILEQIGKFGGPACAVAGSFYWYDSQQRSGDAPQARQQILQARELAIYGGSFTILETVLFGLSHRLNTVESRDFLKKKKFLELLLPLVKGEKKVSDYTRAPLKIEHAVNGECPPAVGLITHSRQELIILGDTRC